MSKLYTSVILFEYELTANWDSQYLAIPYSITFAMPPRNKRDHPKDFVSKISFSLRCWRMLIFNYQIPKAQD